MKVSYFKDGITATKPTLDIDIYKALSEIKGDNYKSKIEKLRNSNGHYKELKKQLPYITFSGTFEKRNNDSIIKYSNHICIDIDDLQEDIEELKDDVTEYPFVTAVFTSPSNKGLKVVCRVGEQQEHKMYFAALERFFKEYLDIVIDKSCKDIARACFVSYDPRAYINEKATRFEIDDYFNDFAEPVNDNNKPAAAAAATTNQGAKQQTNNHKKQVEALVRKIEDTATDITQDYEIWVKAGAALATEFAEAGRDYFHRISCIYHKYDKSETDRKFDNLLKTGKATIASFYGICKDFDITYIEETHEEKLQREYDFFEAYKNKFGEETIKVSRVKFLKALHRLGFRSLDIDAESSIIIKSRNNVIEKASKKLVISDFMKWINKLPTQFPNEIKTSKLAIQDKLLAGIDTYFKDSLIHTLNANLKMNYDSKDTGYFYYKNGFVKVTADNIKLLPYSQLNRAIWKNQILQRDFDYLPVTVTYDTPKHDKANPESCVFADFVKLLSGQNKDRFTSFCSVIGFLLHRYNGRKTFSINFTDINEDVTGEPEGRSGKTLIVKAIGEMLNATKDDKCFLEINGKDFKAEDKYKYQQAEISTSLICINDLDKKFDTEVLFNDISEGIQVDKRYAKNKFNIQPKIATTTNQALRLSGGSARARFIEVEVSNFFNEEYTPQAHFGSWFFSSDWSKKEWKKFDSFMCMCVQIYLKNGILRPDNINLDNRKLIEQTNIDFVIWADEKLLDVNRKYDIKALFDDFKEKNYDFNNDHFRQNTFTKWLKKYAEFRPAYSRKVKHERSNGKAIITFTAARNKAA